MIWTRRSFLIASATAVGGLAVTFSPTVDADPVSSPISSPFVARRGIVSASDEDLYLLFMGFSPVGSEPKRATITCDGVTVMDTMLTPHWQTIWDGHTQPFVLTRGRSLYNAGDSDVRVRCAFSNTRGDAWLIDDGGVQKLRASKATDALVWRDGRAMR